MPSIFKKNCCEPLVVGLTGGIGSGKTTVLQEFQKLEVPCFIADDAANSYYDQPEFIQLVADHFGTNVTNEDGTINRKQVADIVFNNSSELQWINRQIHPKVMRDFMHWYRQQWDVSYVILESAILFEAQIQSLVDVVITVYLEKEERMRRLELRDKTTREALQARMRYQLSAEEKMDRADWVVLNYEGNPRIRQVGYIDKAIRSLNCDEDLGIKTLY